MIDLVRFSGTLTVVLLALPTEALETIAAGLAYIERHVPPELGLSPDGPRSIRLIATADYDVWLITWPPGSGMGDHDHFDSVSVMQVVTGEMYESAGQTRRRLHRGSSLVTPPHAAHRLYNLASTEATTLHVYSPPLAALHARHAEATAAT